MFGNDRSLSSEESYHALENASRGLQCLGQISVHGIWRLFLLSYGLMCCEEVCNLGTYLKKKTKSKTEERKMAKRQTDGMHNMVLVVL